MNIFQEIIKARYWFLPTRDESLQYRKDYKQSCENEIPEIYKKIQELNKQSEQIEKVILDSDQARNFMDLKRVHQDILFQQTRLNHHLEEQAKIIHLNY